MNLHGIATRATATVNKPVEVTIRRSAGYVIGPGRKQVPAYDEPVVGTAKIQALDGKDLKQLDGLNIEGTLRAIYLQGNLAGVIRPESKGGDLIYIGTQEWLVVKVLETWPTWTKCAIALQGGL